MASVTNVLQGGRGVKNGPNLCYVFFERSLTIKQRIKDWAISNKRGH